MHNAGRTSQVSRYLPFLSSLRHYDRAWLRPDIIAGLTLWGLAVPEAMAYAGIAGLPPQAGLYTLVASYVIYALLGTSRHLVVGPTSATAALIASSAAAILGASAAASASDPETYQIYAAAFVLVTGFTFFVAGLARLGFITQFLSKPVMDGFVMGLAIFVAVGQLNKLFGVAKPDGNTVEKFVGIIKELPQTNWVTFALGVTALALLFLLPRLSRKIPAGVVVLVGSIGLSAALDLQGNYDVAIVGTLPQGLPSLSIPRVPLTSLLAMILPALGVLLVAYSESLGVAYEFAEKHGYEVDPDQELNAHALANLVSGVFGGMIAGGSMSSSAVKEDAGGGTQVTNLVTWLATIVTLLFLTPLFTTLPEAILAALIIHAVWHIIASRRLEQVRLVSRTEFWFGVLSMAGVLLIDVLEGMLIGLLASLVFVIYRSSRPHISSLGRIPGNPGAYSDLTRHPENIPVPGILILRLDGPMYYANALTFRNRVKKIIDESPLLPRAVLFDAGAQDQLDLTSAEMFKRLVKDLQVKGITVYLADVHVPVRKFARQAGLLEFISEDQVFPSVDIAVRFLEAHHPPIKNSE